MRRPRHAPQSRRRAAIPVARPNRRFRRPKGAIGKATARPVQMALHGSCARTQPLPRRFLAGDDPEPRSKPISARTTRSATGRPGRWACGPPTPPGPMWPGWCSPADFSDRFRVVNDAGAGVCGAASRGAAAAPGLAAQGADRARPRGDGDPNEVKTRYKELVKRYHPDANGGDRSTRTLERDHSGV